MEIQIQTQIKKKMLDKPIVIDNETKYTDAGDIIKACKIKVKELETERKTYTDPLNDSKKLIIAKFNEILDPLKSYIDKVGVEMSKWYQIEERRRVVEQKKLEEEAIENADDENPDVVVPIVPSAKTIQGTHSKTTMVKTRSFEVENIDLVPREYMMVDEVKIRKDFRTKKIAGIKIIETYKPKSF